MNSNLNSLPLPSLPAYAGAWHRRHRAGPVNLAGAALLRFQLSANALQATDTAPCADQVATIARVLTRQFAEVRRAPCIRLRMRCLTGLRAMARDPHWELAPDERERIARVLAYTQCRDRLIPDPVPVIGGLDTALLLELVWPSVQAAFRDYLDFRLLRDAEAGLRGVPVQQLRYTRDDWAQARAALDAAAARRRWRVSSSSYVPAAPALFRVH